MRERKVKKIFAEMAPIETERLVIDKIKEQDALDMNEYSRRPEVSEYLLWSPHLNLEETKGYIAFIIERYKKGSYADWGLYLKSSGKMIGTCGYAQLDIKDEQCEVGYVLSPDYWGHGYMSEALEAVLGFTFEILRLGRVYLRIMTENKRSQVLAEKASFVLERTVEDEMTVKGKSRSIMHYVLTRERYEITRKSVG